MTVRVETPADAPAIHRIHEEAFGRPDEAELVDALRAEGVVLCSLLAEVQTIPVGHVLFTRLWIDAVPAVALAPVAVLPEHQRKGIGAKLIRQGLEHLVALRERIVVVLGEPEYYSRFGFSAEKAAALKSPFPPEAYMALELEPEALSEVKGPVRYAKAFGLG